MSIMISLKVIMSEIISMVHYQRFQSFYKIIKFGQTLEMNNRLETRYHAFAFIWSAGVIFQLLMISYAALTTRFDMVLGQYGCGLQYITVWNAVAHLLYFGSSLFVDLLPNDNEHKPIFKRILNRVFHTVIFPFTFSVVILFWVLYLQDERLLDKFGALRTIIKPFHNHSMHSTVVPLAILELFIADRPKRFSSVEVYSSVCLVHLVYGGIIFLLNFISGEWPYPFVARMSIFDLFLIMISEVAVSVLIWRTFCWIKDCCTQKSRVKVA